MNCKIYYDDGSVFHLHGEPQRGGPPVRGVQLIAPMDEWNPVSRSDYYVLRDGRYVGVDLFGLFDWLMDLDGKVLFGRMMRQEEWGALTRRAKDEFDRMPR